MSVARGLGQNGGHFYSNITKPVKIDMSFIVDAGNANGLGLRSLKSNGYVRNVFMHTSVAPGSNNGALNPNPALGYALIQLNNNFNSYIGGLSGLVSPLTGGNLVATTNHLAYVITAVGTTTAAQWLAAGVPPGVTPAVGVAFVAIKTGALGGNGTVKVPGVSGISSVEVVGNPNLSIANSSLAANGGAYLLVQFLSASFVAGAYTPAGTISAGVIAVAAGVAGDPVTNNAGVLNSVGGEDLAVNAQTFTGTPAALTGTVSFAAANPADESIVNLSAYFDASSVTIDGL